MSEMRSRVVQAVLAEIDRQRDEEREERRGELMAGALDEGLIAHRAIEAMQEPDDAMKRQYDTLLRSLLGSDETVVSSYHWMGLRGWRAMIDAALTPSAPTVTVSSASEGAFAHTGTAAGLTPSA